jgi:hypothetical protein
MHQEHRRRQPKVPDAELNEQRRTPRRRAIERPITGSELRLLHELWQLQRQSQAKGIPFAYPSQKYLAAKLGFGGDDPVRHVRSLLKRLSARGAIVVGKPAIDDELAELVNRFAEERKMKRPGHGWNDVYFVKWDPDRLDEYQPARATVTPRTPLRRRHRSRSRPERPDQPKLFDAPNGPADAGDHRSDHSGDDRSDHSGDDRSDHSGDGDRAPLDVELKQEQEGEAAPKVASLVRAWQAASRAPRTKADDPGGLATMFAELLRLGVPYAAIAAEISRPDRPRHEAVWHLAHRLRPSRASPANRSMFSGLSEWLNEGGADDTR